MQVYKEILLNKLKKLYLQAFARRKFVHVAFCFDVACFHYTRLFSLNLLILFKISFYSIFCSRIFFINLLYKIDHTEKVSLIRTNEENLCVRFLNFFKILFSK